MKTTLELPDDLMRTIKLKAAREDRSIKDVTTELLRRGLAATSEGRAPRRTAFPLIACPAGPVGGLDPRQVAEVLLDADADAVVP